jgi:hypothetical protein
LKEGTKREKYCISIYIYTHTHYVFVVIVLEYLRNFVHTHHSLNVTTGDTAHAFFMALLARTAIAYRCNRWGSGDAVLKMLRNRHTVNTRLTSSVRIEKALAHSSGPRFVLALCTQARPALLHLAPSLSPFEAEHYMPCLLKSLRASCLANMETKGVHFPTSLRLLLHPSGSFPA